MRLEARLQGHTAPVLCCSAAPGENPSILASGGEDGLCIFNLEAGSKLQRVPAPRVISDDRNGCEVAALCFAPATANTVYAAVGPNVLCVDTRNPDGAVAIICTCSDDISSVAVSHKGNHLAVADDSGEVQIVDLSTNRPFKILRAAHSNICSSVSFRRHSPWDLMTGSMDMTVAKWDFSRGKCLSRWSMQSSSPEDEVEGPQMFNPPMVHHLAVPSSLGSSRPWCRLVAVARGDGALSVFDADASAEAAQKPSAAGSHKGSKGQAADSRGGAAGGKEAWCSSAFGVGLDMTLDRGLGGHTAAASSLCWITGSPRGVRGGSGAEGGGVGNVFVASGGDDRRILIWDITLAISLAQAGCLTPPTSQPAAAVSKVQSGTTVAEADSRIDDLISSLPGGAAPFADQQGVAPTSSDSGGVLRYSHLHKRKVNCLCTADSGGKQFLYVADTSKLISCYVLDCLDW